MTTTTTQRDLPRPEFTDAEAGAREFPDSNARRFNYYTPQKRKQSHYEDVTVEVQPDPRHYLSQGWLYGFSDGRGGYPLDWTALKAWGSDRPEPERFPGSGGRGYDWPALGWHEFRDPNEEWELTLYRYNANVVRQINANIDTARETKAFEQWNRNWVTFVERNIGAWMHVEHGLGLYLFANANRRAPTNMHNNAISVNSMHRIRTAQDLALYNLTLSEEIEGFDGAAHIETWNSDPAWQGVRKTAEQLTGIDDWCEAIFAANVVFEPLVGELFRSQLVQQAAPGNGDFVTPTIVGAGEYDYAQRDLRYTIAMFELLTNDREFADHNKAIMDEWLSVWVPRAISASRTLQPLWSQPDFKPPRFEDGLDRAKSRFSGILSQLGLAEPEGADPVSVDLKAPVESPFKSDNTASNMCGFTLMNNQVGAVVAEVMATKDNVKVMPLPSMIRVDAVGRMDVVYDEISEALGEEPGFFDAAEFEENMSTHYGRMIHEDDRTIMFANPEDAAE